MKRLSEFRDRVVGLLPEFVTAFPFEGLLSLFSLLSIFRVWFDEFGIYQISGQPLDSYIMWIWILLMLWGLVMMILGAVNRSYYMRIWGIRLTALMQIARALMIWEGFGMSPLLWAIFIMTIVIALFSAVIAEHFRLVHVKVKRALILAEQE